MKHFGITLEMIRYFLLKRMNSLKSEIFSDCKVDVKLSLQTVANFINDSKISEWQKSYLQNALLPS
ncbi:unnamed protein product [Brugia timori]|uniref:Transposase n=1 Tax=Brugia timori TaxID=42155 RepID=A0A0R3QCK4_9BILA|nr:unnamed protein product [Brugia timori]